MSESLGRTKLADPTLESRERKRVEEVLRSGSIAAGDEVRCFEDEFARFCGTEFGVATANGTSALHTALHATGIQRGDRVLTTPFSFIASANAIRFVGASPEFVDINPETYAIDCESVKAAISSDDGIDAILVVHLYGLPGPVAQLADLAADHDLVLVEDAAQAHGARANGQSVGSFGDVGCFSFYPTKNMTTGEGGMIVTDSQDVADRARRFINHGRTGGYEHAEVGFNFRMTDIAAAIGRVQLEKLPDAIAARRENAAVLNDGLAELPVATPVEPTGHRHVFNQYTLRCSDRDDLRRELDAHGIDSGVYYPKPIHEQPPYRTNRETFPEAERASREVVSLPVHPQLDAGELRRMISAIGGWAR